MSQTKYHKNKQGVWSKCEVTIKPCPLGAAAHKELTRNTPSMTTSEGKKVSKAAIARVENIVLNHLEDFPIMDIYPTLLDQAIIDVAGTPKATTVFELVEREDLLNPLTSDIIYNGFVATLFKHKLVEEGKLSELIASDQNLLNEPDDGKLANEGWRAGYSHTMACRLVEYGQPVNLQASFYGWVDYDLVMKRNDKPVVILDYKEDRWDAFEGTFTDSSSHHGITGAAVWADGTQRLIRWEGDTSEIIKTLFHG